MNHNEPPRPKGTQGQPPDKQEVARAMSLAFYQFKLIYVGDSFFPILRFRRAGLTQGECSLPHEMCFQRQLTSFHISTLSVINYSTMLPRSYERSLPNHLTPPPLPYHGLRESSCTELGELVDAHVR